MKTLQTVEFPSTGIYTVRFSPDAKRLAAAGADGHVRLIETATGKVLKEFLPVTIQPASMVAPRKLNRKQKFVEFPSELLPNDLKLASLEVTPKTIDLHSPFDYVQILVTGRTKEGDSLDLTRFAKMTPSSEHLTIDKRGIVRGWQDGAHTLKIQHGKLTADVIVNVSGLADDRPTDFVQDVMPIISKLGCNQGTCHGSKDGKNGFKLSLRGYDALYDVRSFTDDLSSRRVNVASPDQSVMLLKSTGSVAHVGGQLTQPGEVYYEVIRKWIAEGARLELKGPRVKSIQIHPLNPVVQKIGSTQQMRVIATYTDGSTRDVTQQTFLSSGDTEVATTDDFGLMTTLRRGEAPILARYEGRYAATTLMVMGDRSGFAWQEPPMHNEIDRHVANKLKHMKILSSGICSDAEFLRRVTLDLTGVPPTPETVQKFLADKRDSLVKRNEMIDQLIGSEAYIDFWTNKWADLLQVNRKYLGPQGAKSFRDWIQKQVAENRPYDEFVHHILTASGSNKENPPASYYKILREPADMMENTTHLFLGVRFSCNKCHDHPFERWTQDQYYETAAYFAQVSLKKDPAAGNSQIGRTAVEAGKPLYEIIYEKPDGEVRHDRTGAVTAPQFPYVAEYKMSEGEKQEHTRRETTGCLDHLS